MSKGPHASPQHQKFFADVKAVMDKHPEVSGNFYLAHIKDASLLGAPQAAAGDCLVWAIDPRTGQRYCLEFPA